MNKNFLFNSFLHRPSDVIRCSAYNFNYKKGYVSGVNRLACALHEEHNSGQQLINKFVYYNLLLPLKRAHRKPMFVLEFVGALFRFSVKAPEFDPLFQLPPRRNPRCFVTHTPLSTCSIRTRSRF